MIEGMHSRKNGVTGKYGSPEQRHPGNCYRAIVVEICMSLSVCIQQNTYIFRKDQQSVSTPQPCPSGMFQTTYLFLHLFNQDVVPFMCQILDMEKNQANIVSAFRGPTY